MQQSITSDYCAVFIPAAGLLAKKAVEAGLKVPPYVKTSLSPGSGVVTKYLENSGLLPYLEQLGYHIVGYGCMTCIGNSGPLPEQVVEAIEQVFLTLSSLVFKRVPSCLNKHYYNTFNNCFIYTHRENKIVHYTLAAVFHSLVA